MEGCRASDLYFTRSPADESWGDVRQGRRRGISIGITTKTARQPHTHSCEAVHCKGRQQPSPEQPITTKNPWHNAWAVCLLRTGCERGGHRADVRKVLVRLYALGRSGRPYRSSPLCCVVVRMSGPCCERGSKRRAQGAGRPAHSAKPGRETPTPETQRSIAKSNPQVRPE